VKEVESTRGEHLTLANSGRKIIPRPGLPSVVEIKRDNEDRAMLLTHEQAIENLADLFKDMHARVKALEEGQARLAEEQKEHQASSEELRAQQEAARQQLEDKWRELNDTIQDQIKSLGEGLARNERGIALEKRSISMYKKEDRQDFAGSRLVEPSTSKEKMKVELTALAKELEGKMSRH
jgi:hypothetical protein